jgi:antitoxin VapB
MPASPPSEPATREARLFRNNRSQAVRIPADWELPGDRVAIRRDGERLILEPLRPRGLLGLLSSWDALDEALPDPDDPPPPAEPDLEDAFGDVPGEAP